MKKLKLFAIAALISTHCFGQWKQLNSGTTQSWLYDIECPSKDTCYAVGMDGTVLKTVDGETWQLKNSGILNNLTIRDIFCLDADNCFLAAGYFYETHDGGNTWLESILPNPVWGVYFVNDSVGYATGSGGGEYFKTTDGGKNWSWEVVKIHKSGNTSPFFINENVGFFGNGNGVLKTENGGGKWVFILGTKPSTIRDIYFLNDSVGFAVGDDGKAYRTRNQGATWDTLNTGTGKTLYSIYCMNNDTCYISGSNGTMLKTTDGGNTFKLDTVGVPPNILFAVAFSDAQTGYAVGTAGTILKTDKNVGIIDLKMQTQVFITPNPTSENINIHYFPDNKTNPQNTVFELYDIVGRKQLVHPLFPGENTINKNELSQGIYIYKIISQTQTIKTGKLFIS